MPFSELFGLDQPIAALQRMLEAGQVAGTYLFVGPSGVGKTALAQALAQAAACTGIQVRPFDACGECESCRRAGRGTHPEIVLIPPAGDRTQIWQFWDRDNRPSGVLQHALSFAPLIGRRRVFIVERADALTEQAANSLLKALEEPPPFVIFVLLAPHPARMIATILSRSHMVRLVPGAAGDLAQWLAEHRGVPAERARALAVYAGGRTGAAVRLASDPKAWDEIERSMDLAVTIAGAPRIRALKCAEEIRRFAADLKALVDVEPGVGAVQDRPLAAATTAAGEETGAPVSKERVGRHQLAATFDLLAATYRDLLALRLNSDDASMPIQPERRQQMAALATRRTPHGWMAGIEALVAARRRVDQNASIPLLTDWLALELMRS